MTIIKNINKQIEIGADNTNKFMLGEFNFSSKNILNKTLIFDTSKIDQEIVMDRITDAINDKNNDEFYNKHQPGSNYFALSKENGR